MKITNNFINIQSFMVDELNLKGNELLVYAIIYGFSQDGESKYNGSLQYLADWTNSTKQGVLKNIKSLIEKGLIEKCETKYNNITLISYSSKFNGIKQSLTGIKQSLPNNIEYNIDNIEKENILKEKDNINNNVEENNKIVKKRKTSDELKELIDTYCFSNDMLNGINDWLKHKKQKQNKPYTKIGLKGVLDKMVENISLNGEKQTLDCIYECISRNYAGLFYNVCGCVKTQQNKNNTTLTLEETNKIIENSNINNGDYE